MSEVQEEAVPEEVEKEEEKPVLRPRRSAQPVSVRIYRDEAGHRFVGIDSHDRVVKETETEDAYETVQEAKQAAHMEYPTLPIR